MAVERVKVKIGVRVGVRVSKGEMAFLGDVTTDGRLT